EGFVEQPLAQGYFSLVCNSEIYNYKELAKKHNFVVRNDADLIFKYMINNLSIDDFDGVYAFAYKTKDKIILARDLLGVKPLWYCYSEKTKEFGFASERKALLKEGFDKN